MDFLFKKRDSRQLALLRIVIGLWFLTDMISMLVSGYVTEAYVTPVMNFPFYGFEWIAPLPGYGMYLLFILLIIISIGIILGYRLKICLSMFLIGFSYVFMCDIVYTLNKFYLFLILGIVLLVTNSHKNISLIPKEKKVEKVEHWQILIFQLLFGLIYTFSGISKLNTDWLVHGEPLIFFFKHKIPFSWLSSEIYIFFVFAFTYGGVAFDLSIIWLLSFKKTNLIGNILQGMFHLLNFSILWIGSLSLFSIALTWILFPTAWLKRKLSFSTTLIQSKDTSLVRKKIITIALSIFLLLNILIPLRHFIVGTEVNWTEKGHRFSWRLMTRSKNGSSSRFRVVNHQNGETIEVDPRKLLTGRQYRKMSAETDLVITFAHYLRDTYQQKFGHDNLSVYATIKTRLNGRKRNLLINPDLDLAKTSRSFLFDPVSLPQKNRYREENSSK